MVHHFYYLSFLFKLLLSSFGVVLGLLPRPQRQIAFGMTALCREGAMLVFVDRTKRSQQ
jgi:hypothetical protein